VTEQQGDQAALSAAKNLTAALGTMSAEVRRLSAYGHRNRRMIWGLIISIALDVTLTVVVAVFAVQAHDANTSAAAARAVAAVAQQDSQALCEAGNVARAQQVDLWDYVLSLSRKPTTPEQEKVVAQFEQHLHAVFAPRNCAALGQGGR
jgi:hypothetical protein